MGLKGATECTYHKVKNDKFKWTTSIFKSLVSQYTTKKGLIKRHLTHM